ncbi:NAD-dependent succinate-semialdehyde dehydrogenase [Candidatus Nitrosotenuis uzonensis]|uniref:Putative succinate-semialdehyde dehydrogenase (NADP(+)) n=1 Tax=Candidatus Nitrosotenuis uzonensis TaxID=1407055 RepID=A0A812F2H3_9ARCH|nr:NAD-dependent succinate-semialdehyde dehydrogenase [Candidatus Nitrosotenuis uzonensis]CAE6500965.1 putative succinate-semialdehyde dehydrogenase (NADP(+)) [Candidatus Nitrosotenuis uzonensis]
MKTNTTNPATEQILQEYDVMSKDQVNEIVKNSKEEFGQWKKDIHKRIELVHNFADELRKNKTVLAETATNEMGKPIKESISEIEKCAWVMEFYADNGQVFINDESLNSDARKTVISFEPLGIIASIMPWNFPYWQISRFAAPSLIVGNTIILKPASATLQCGIELAKIFQKAGFPDGVFHTVVGNSSVAEYLLDSPFVNGVTFTGSTTVGIKVAQKASTGLKKCVLELGGSDSFIVCSDADVEKASEGAVKGRFINCGQSCVASKRFILVEDIAEDFLERFVQKTDKLRVGNPLSADTDIGPLVNGSALKTIDDQVSDAKNKGAQILTGGNRVGNKGYFYSPTIIKNISKEMRLYNEETFGPVASVFIVDDEKEAIKQANESEFGLGGSIWTSDYDKAEKMARSLESGMVSINNMMMSDPRVPFGGIKHSGFGRELSRYGMLEFVNIKSIRFYDRLTHNHHVE